MSLGKWPGPTVVQKWIAAAVSAGLGWAAIGHSIASQGDSISRASRSAGVPLRNSRLHQQPRPVSAPAAPNGHAVELIGTIEPCPYPAPVRLRRASPYPPIIPPTWSAERRG